MSTPRASVRRAALLGAIAALALLAGGGAAVAAEPTGTTWPAYAGNTVKAEAPGGRLIAGSVQRVQLSGHAFWSRLDLDFSYTLGLYVQDADVDAHCTPTYGGQRQKAINLGSLNALASGSGWAVDETMSINAEPPKDAIDWSAESLPFTVRPGVRNVVVCAYVRYVIDDVAYYELPLRIEQPRCRVLPAAVRAGGRAALRCNVNGSVKAVLSRRGARPRTLSLRIDDRGRGQLATRRLAPGRWSVRFSGAGWKLGSDRLTVR